MTRQRSNALSGPSDPRWRSSLERDLIAELGRPINMGDTLTQFLRKVFKRQKALFENNDNLADELYDMYSGVASASAPHSSKQKRFFESIWRQCKKPPVLTDVRLQYTGISLRRLVREMRKGGLPTEDQLTDFIYFKMPNKGPMASQQRGISYRVYANAKFDAVPKIIDTLKRYASTTENHLINAFKVVGPAAIEGRRDTMVIYCGSSDAAKNLAKRLAKHQGRFRGSVPAMTTKMATGIATGAEPKWQATGLGRPKGDYGPEAQSFGTIRCELIAAAILSYQANRHEIKPGFKNFQRFVAVAFRGYGLDPASPGDNAGA